MSQKNESVIKEVLLNASVSKVWKAITDKNDMKQWYFDLAEFKPEVGFEFQFEGKGLKGEKYLHLCRITEIIPDKKISYTWRYDGYPGSSLVTFELFDEDGKTRIKLTHEGLDSFDIDNPDFAKENFAAGWNELIGKNLKDYVEKK
jgi:uncharacterized protein YndB with AHSA1/START domain